MTEIQTLRVQNCALQLQTARSQIALLEVVMRQVQTDLEGLIRVIEAEHPGWLVNRQTLQLERVRE